MTSCPSFAKQAAETQPTYPNPKILNFISSLSNELSSLGLNDSCAPCLAPYAATLCRAPVRSPVDHAFANLHESLRGVLPPEPLAYERASLIAEPRREMRIAQHVRDCLREIFRLVGYYQ